MDTTILSTLTILAVFWFIIAFLPAVIAENKGRSFFGFLLLSILISPILGLIMALIVEPGYEHREEKAKLRQSADYQECLYCGESIKMSAVVCRFCGRDLEQVNALPQFVECPHCSITVELDRNERLKGEFTCPMCLKVANRVLPIS